MTIIDMILEDRLSLLEQLATQSLSLWDLPPGAKARLINVSENTTYLVEAPGGSKTILRIHRENYHSVRAIECELAWINALAQSTDIAVPQWIFGGDGKAVQKGKIEGLKGSHSMVMFKFIEGSAPDERGDLTVNFEKLGTIAAKTHLHSIRWARPEPFERLKWGLDEIFGKNPTWGDWRDAPGVNIEVKAVLEEVEERVKQRLDVFGKSKERYGLIHADMRLANLLVEGEDVCLIDFDDCGMGWFLYDFAAGISFIEDDPRIPALKAAWVKGYRSVRALSREEEAEIDTFVMLRRLALLAWIGSHREAPEPQALAPDFAIRTRALGVKWLARF